MFILETVSYQIKFQIKHIYLGWWNDSINRRTTYGYQTNFKQSVGMGAELSSTGTLTHNEIWKKMGTATS